MRLEWIHIAVCLFLIEEAIPEEGVNLGGKNTEVYIVAVGAKPSRRYADDSGYDSPIMLLPESGEVPPARLFYETDSTKGEVKWEVINISFNNAPLVNNIPAEKELRLYRKVSGEYEFYMTLPKLSGSEYDLLILTPSKKKEAFSSKNKLWNESPEIHRLNLDSLDQSTDGIFLKNISSLVVESVIGCEHLKVKSGGFLHQRYKGETGFINLSASYSDTTSKQLICKTAIGISHQNRQLLLVYYDANTETNGGKKVGVLRLLIPEYRRRYLAPSE